MSVILTLNGVGFRQCGPLPATGGGLEPRQVAEMAGRSKEYEVTGHWVRRPGRKKGSRPVRAIEIIDTLDKDSALVDDRLAYAEEYFRSEFATIELDYRLVTESENLVSLADDAAQGQCP